MGGYGVLSNFPGYPNSVTFKKYCSSFVKYNKDNLRNLH